MRKDYACGWKVFGPELKCRGHQFEVGRVEVLEGEPGLCVNGFHFHERSSDVFNYYQNDAKNRVCEVEAWNVETEGDKSCATRLLVKRELSFVEICRLVHGYGYGHGYGHGYGYGYGHGDGDGDGYGDGYGYGYGHGDGDGYGHGYGHGHGYDYGDGTSNTYKLPDYIQFIDTNSETAA